MPAYVSRRGYEGNPSARGPIVDYSLSLTTHTTITADCDLEVSKRGDGYALPLLNTLAASDAERAYLTFTPYGENASDSWVKYGSGGLTGDVAHNAADSSSNQIIWQGAQACGVVLTDNSGTDAVKMGAGKMCEPSCFAGSSTTKMGIKGLFDKGATLLIPFHIDEVKVDYDATASGGDELVTGQGDTAENLFDVDGVFLEGTTDRIANTITG